MLDRIDKVITRFDHDQSFFPINRFCFSIFIILFKISNQGAIIYLQFNSDSKINFAGREIYFFFKELLLLSLINDVIVSM